MALHYPCSNLFFVKNVEPKVFYLKKAIFTADVLKHGAASGKDGAAESPLEEEDVIVAVAQVAFGRANAFPLLAEAYLAE